MSILVPKDKENDDLDSYSSSSESSHESKRHQPKNRQEKVDAIKSDESDSNSNDKNKSMVKKPTIRIAPSVKQKSRTPAPSNIRSTIDLSDPLLSKNISADKNDATSTNFLNLVKSNSTSNLNDAQIEEVMSELDLEELMTSGLHSDNSNQPPKFLDNPSIFPQISKELFPTFDISSYNSLNSTNQQYLNTFVDKKDDLFNESENINMKEFGFADDSNLNFDASSLSNGESESTNNLPVPIKYSEEDFVLPNMPTFSKSDNNIFANQMSGELEKTLLKKCQKCSKTIKEEGIFINGLFYHKKCCFCEKCKKELHSKSKCILYHEKLHCKKCCKINKKSKIEICQVCLQNIYDQTELIHFPNGFQSHLNCLSCYRCGKCVFNSRKNEQYKKKINKEDHGKVKNYKILDDNGFHFILNDEILKDKIICIDCESVLKTQKCCSCEKIIYENAIKKHKKLFHQRCFKCEICNEQLFGNSFVIHHNRFLCWKHGEIYANSCAFCKTHFKNDETDKIRWNGKLFHHDCFVCRVCGNQLDVSTCKTLHRRPHCSKCFDIRKSEGDTNSEGKSLNHHHVVNESQQRMKRFKEQHDIDVIFPRYGDQKFETAEDIQKDQPVVFKNF